MDEYLLPDQGDYIIRTNEFRREFSGKSLGVMLFEQMKKYKDNVAQIDALTAESNTYGELLQQSIRVAVEMKNRGINQDDIICICSHNTLKACIPYIAGLLIGAQISALDPIMSFTDMKHLLSQVPPKMVFTTIESQEVLEQIVRSLNLESTGIIPFDSFLFKEFLAPIADEDKFKPVVIEDVFKTAVIFFSSGTTGLPKGICINHYTLIQQSYIFQMIDTNFGVSMGFASLYWISSVNILLYSILFGQARLICPGFDPKQVWYFLDKFKVIKIFLASTQAILLLKSKKPSNMAFKNLERVFVGGAPVSSELFSGLQKVFPYVQVSQGYGWTEIGGMIATSSNNLEDILLFKDKPRSCGRPLPGMWYKVVDVENEKIVGPNQKGELRLKTKYQTNGYYNVDSSTAWDSDGWIKTGDIVYYDEDYCFYIQDRIKELIKYRGWHVSPALLEGILLKHPAVKLSAVVGVPHKEDNEHPLALVVLENGLGGINDINEEQLRNFVDNQVDDNKKLRAGVRIVDDLPKTPSGKINRYALKKQVLPQFL